MKSGIFQDAVESSTRVFGRKEVRVIFQGSEAETTGNTVVLPALPPSAEITVEQADVVRGYRDHEAMHVRCTDTSKASLDKLEELTEFDKNLGQLAQFCEDIRIENAGIQEYVGMRHNLSAVNKRAAKDVIEQLEEHGDPAHVITQVPPILQFRVALQSLAREKLGIDLGAYSELNQHIKAANPKLFDLAEKFADHMVDLPTGVVNGALDEAKSKAGTAKSFELARQIYDAYGEFERNPPPPPPPPAPAPSQGAPGNGDGGGGQGQQGDEGEGDTGAGDAQGAGQGQGQGAGDGQGAGGDQPGQQGAAGGGAGGGQDDGSSDQGEGSGAEQADDQGGQQGGGRAGQGSGGDRGNSVGSDDQDEYLDVPAPPPPPIDQDKLKDLDLDLDYKSALKDVVDDINGAKPDASGVMVTPKFRVFAPRMTISAGFMEWYKQDHQREEGLRIVTALEQEISGKRAMIRRTLELELQARHDRHWQSGHKSGRLHSVRLVDAIQGRESVYQKREDGRDMDTLLRMDIDASGSMGGGKIRNAILLALALTEALERTGCDIEVNLYTDSDAAGKSKGRYTAAESRDAYTAWQLDYDQRWQAWNKTKAGQAGQSLPALYAHMGLLTMRQVKGIRQRSTDPAVRAAFGLASNFTTGGTPSIPATFHALREMGKEQHAKKIYLHLTDGQPDHPLEKSSVSDLMAEAQALAISTGVHMIGVGVDGCDVRHMFRDNVVIRGSDAYEPVIRKIAKLIAQEVGHGRAFKRAA